MKKVDRRRRWLWLIALAAAIALGWFALRPSPSRIEHATTDDRPAAKALATTVVPQVTSPTGSARVVDPRPARAAALMPQVMQAALDDNPHLAPYYRLAQKALRTEQERGELRGMLADTELIELVKHDLLAVDESAFSREAEAKRMVAVEFLSDAVEWDDNPAMATVMQAIEEVVLARNISTSGPEDLARSLAGDKMELYTQMLHRTPDRATLIAERARGKAAEALLTYAKDWYDREMRAMKADEIR